MKLSIIIPAYNVESFLSKCLDSVIYPELKDYEIILVNDGSSDSTGEIAQAYAEKWPELITLITKKNGGLGSARNAAIEIALGEYILFLDSDDWLAANALTEIMEVLERDYDIVIFDLSSVNINGDVISTIQGCSREGELSLSEYPELLFQPPAACNKLFRRKFFADGGLRFLDRAWFEDLRLTPKLYLETEKILSLRKAWYCYLQRPGSITNAKNAVRNLEIIEAVDDLSDYFREKGKLEQYKKQMEYIAFYNQFLTGSIRVILADRKSAALERLRSDFLEKYPDFRENVYFKTCSFRHKLLTRLLLHRQWNTVYLLMSANNRIKGKDK